MTDAPDHIDEQFERLVNRALDGELTPHEQEELDHFVKQDPAAARFYEEMSGIDALVGETLRVAIAAEPAEVPIAPSSWWRTFGIAAAACIAALMYFGEPPAADSQSEPDHGEAQAGLVNGESIWADAQVDGLTPLDPEVFDRLRAGVQDVDRDWVIIPSDEPGEYLLIEVSRVRTEAYTLHADF